MSFLPTHALTVLIFGSQVTLLYYSFLHLRPSVYSYDIYTSLADDSFCSSLIILVARLILSKSSRRSRSTRTTLTAIMCPLISSFLYEHAREPDWQRRL
ncbi:hypothetical protein BDZ89DRAFT_1204218 [Hymenopellis radicata]|nr:hypothetical protein BDZ89DRAFT_1204218 [Hymenopellis radicata]